MLKEVIKRRQQTLRYITAWGFEVGIKRNGKMDMIKLTTVDQSSKFYGGYLTIEGLKVENGSG